MTHQMDCKRANIYQNMQGVDSVFCNAVPADVAFGIYGKFSPGDDCFYCLTVDCIA